MGSWGHGHQQVAFACASMQLQKQWSLISSGIVPVVPLTGPVVGWAGDTCIATLQGSHWGSTVLCGAMQATAQARLTITLMSPLAAFLSVGSLIFSKSISLKPKEGQKVLFFFFGWGTFYL